MPEQACGLLHGNLATRSACTLPVPHTHTHAHIHTHTRTQGDAYDAFVKAAQKTEDVLAFETTDSAVAKAAGLTAPGVAAVVNHEGGRDAQRLPLPGRVPEAWEPAPTPPGAPRVCGWSVWRA
jgi:hypothetical protein